ncbi:MAG: NHL repeat-containing protein [Thiolinea sp.]
MNIFTVFKIDFIKSWLRPSFFIAFAMIFYSLPAVADLELIKTVGETSLIDSVTDLAVGPQGTIYLLDGVAKKTHKISSTGKSLLSWNEGNGLSLAINQQGQVYVRNYSGIRKLTQHGKLIKKLTVDSSSVDSAYASDITIDANNYVYINIARVIYVYDKDLNFVKTIKTYNNPAAVKFGLIKKLMFNKSNLFIQTNAAILQLDETSKLINRLALNKIPVAQSNNSYNLAFDATGSAYVSDPVCHCIKQFDWQGNVTKTLGSLGNEPGKFFMPTVLVFDSNNQLVIGDASNFRLQKIALTGSALWTAGDEPNKFKNPSDLALDSTGNIYVLDQGHARVQKYSADGTWLASWGSRGNQAGQLANLEKMTINPMNDRVYIQDSYSIDAKSVQRTQIFNTDGVFLRANESTLPSFDAKGNSYQIVLKSKDPTTDDSSYYNYIFDLQKIDINADLIKEWKIIGEESRQCISLSSCQFISHGPIASSLAVSSKSDIYYLSYYKDNFGYYLSLNKQNPLSDKPEVLVESVRAGGVANLLADKRDFIYMGFFEDRDNPDTSERRMAVYNEAFELLGYIYQTFNYPNPLYDHGYVASAADEQNNLYLLKNKRLEIYSPASSLKAPTLISAKVMDAKGTVKLTWKDRTSDESGFKIKVCNGQGVNCADKDMVTVKTTAANVTSVLIPSLAAKGSDVLKTFRMTSFKGTEESLVSNEISLTY